ncbi:unnamed protein product [Penicillium nalgiovense]|nr:unnamed protein product [Penicillium nalgiovense]
MSVRKAHNSGRNHLRNVVDYYQQIGQEKAQSVIDSITSSYAAGPTSPQHDAPRRFPASLRIPGTTRHAPSPLRHPSTRRPGAPGMIPPPGAHGLPFPPPFPNAAGTRQQAASPRPSPTCLRAQTCRFRPQAASRTSLFLRQVLRASRLCLVNPVWRPVVRRPFLLVPVAWRGILLPLEVGLLVDLLVGWINGGDQSYDLGVASYMVCF